MYMRPWSCRHSFRFNCFKNHTSVLRLVVHNLRKMESNRYLVVTFPPDISKPEISAPRIDNSTKNLKEPHEIYYEVLTIVNFITMTLVVVALVAVSIILAKLKRKCVCILLSLSVWFFLALSLSLNITISLSISLCLSLSLSLSLSPSFSLSLSLSLSYFGQFV